MFKPDLKADLTAVAAIFTLLILIPFGYHTYSSSVKHAQQLELQLSATTDLVNDLYEENSDLHYALSELNKSYDQVEADLKYYRKLSGIKESLRKHSLEEQATGLALGWTESEWNHFATHNSSAQGICGVMPIWDPYLADLNIDPNSVEACIAIYNYYLNQTKSQVKALKEYKGIESNKHMWIVRKTLEVRSFILHKLKED